MAFGFEAGQRAIRRAQRPPKPPKATPSEQAFGAAHGVAPSHAKVSALPKTPPPTRQHNAVQKVRRINTQLAGNARLLRALTAPSRLTRPQRPPLSTTGFRQGLGTTSSGRVVGLTPKQSQVELSQQHAAAHQQKQQTKIQEAHTGFNVGPVHVSPLDIGLLGVPGVGFGSDVARLGAKEALTVGAEKLAGKGGSKAVEAVRGVRAAAKEAKAAKVAERGGGGLRKLPERFKTAPGRAVTKVRRIPKAAKTAPARAAIAVSTKEGRKVAATQAGARLYSHPAAGYAVAAAGAHQAGVNVPGGALVKGTEQALLHHPLETAGTTLRAAPAAIAAPAALAYQAGASVVKGSPQPFLREAKAQASGVKQIGEHLLSSDPKVVERAVQKEGGLAFLAPLPAVTRLRTYERARGRVRALGTKMRAKIATSRFGENKLAPTRHGPQEEHLFAKAERHQARKRVAITKARAENPHLVALAQHRKNILHGTSRKPALSGAPKGSGVALSTLVEYGIRKPQDVAFVRQHGPVGERAPAGKVNLRTALDYADAHPEIFTDPHFKRALDAAVNASRTTPAAVAGAGERARVAPQAQLFGHIPPEDMVPVGAKAHTDAATRTDAWKQANARDKEITRWRAVAAKARAHAEVLKGKEKATARADTRKALEQAKQLQAKNTKLKKALDPYTRPGQNIDTSARQAYDKQMLADYVQKTEAARKKTGLSKAAWTHHASLQTSPGLGLEEARFPVAAGRKEHMRSTGEGSLAARDLTDRGLSSFIAGTVEMPRRRAAGKQFIRDLVSTEKRTFRWDGKPSEVVQDSGQWKQLTGPKTEINPNGGQFDPREYGRFPYREWNRAISDPFKPENEAHLNAILTEAEQGRVKHGEPSVVMLRETIREARNQIQPHTGSITKGLNIGARIANRAILGTNPAWAIAQIPAEGIPLLMAHPELAITGPKLVRDIHRYRRTHPEEAFAIDGTAGASPASLRTPADLQESYNPSPEIFEKGADALTHGRVRRAASATARLKPLGLFDVARQKDYRTLLMLAEGDKRFRSFAGNLSDLFTQQYKLSRQFKGKSREELWNWLSTTKEGQRQMHKLADYVDNVQGNWTAFSKYERDWAPVTIFYPFLRYSLRWTFWTFPRTHPVTASLAYLLAQQNSNQLEKLLGAKPVNPFQYAFPVLHNAQGQPSQVLPGGSRISPGQSAPQTAVQAGSPGQALSSLNPFLGAALTAVGGPGPFGTKPTEPAGWAAIDQLLAMPAPIRLALQTPQGRRLHGQIIGKPQSVISKAFSKLDPNKAKRSLLAPFLPQSGANAKMANDLSRALTQASANSSQAQKAAAGNGVSHAQILKMQAKEKQASDQISKILKHLGLGKEDAKSYAQYKKSLYGSSGSSSSTGLPSLSGPTGPVKLPDLGSNTGPVKLPALK